VSGSDRMWRAVLAVLVAGLALAQPAAAQEPRLESVTLTAAPPKVALDGTTSLSVRGTMSDGSRADLEHADVTVTGGDRNVQDVTMHGDEGVLHAGTMGPGTSTLTASVTLDGATATDDLQVEVLPRPARPWIHDYTKTLTMKMFMADNKGQVSLTFEQGLEVVKKVDNLTRGIPKIFYLVGWQYDGHDTGYPAWDVVNPKLKRPQDATALDSLLWLIREARRYHTTISFHVNMLDASSSSPLWQEYLDRDVIARWEDGSLRTYTWGYPISYTREWDEGLTRRRIDQLFEMFPMRDIGTIHVDAFHQYIPGQGNGPISPWHGITTDQEIETQKKIIRLFRDRGVDVTSEFAYSYRKDPLLGLQPLSWHFRNVDQMRIPPSLHIGGEGGDARFGQSMLGENRIRSDSQNLTGFQDEFSRTTLLWQYLNRLDRISDEGGVVTFSGGVTSRREADGRLVVRQGDVLLRDGDDLFVPALWKEHEIVAYSRNGYASRTWRMPQGWEQVQHVDVYRIGLGGLTPVAGNVRVRDGALELSLPAGAAVSIVPAGTAVTS
jgi:Endo-alpha-N-acetylgalactosaminidase